MESAPNISRRIADEVRRSIVNCELAPGTRLNEVHLAQSLGVSRTPLREGLATLVAEGSLEVQPRRGFFITPLSRTELKEVYPVRALLDPAALRLAGVPESEKLAYLESLNEQLKAESNVEKRIDLDDKWHLALFEDCGNHTLIDLIKQFMRRTRRYEIGYLRDGRNMETMADEHRDIIAALRAKDLDRACEKLEQNMQSGLATILAWLDERDAEALR